MEEVKKRIKKEDTELKIIADKLDIIIKIMMVVYNIPSDFIKKN